jgi:hypothetical protein
MAQRVEVTVADIVRSLVKGVISQRIAVRKLEALMQKAHAEGANQGLRVGTRLLEMEDRSFKTIPVHDKPVIHTDNL